MFRLLSHATSQIRNETEPFVDWITPLGAKHPNNHLALEQIDKRSRGLMQKITRAVVMAQIKLISSKVVRLYNKNVKRAASTR